MSVAEVLAQIADHNQSVRAVVLTAPQGPHSHLTPAYGSLDVVAFGRYGQHLLGTLGALDVPDGALDSVFLEFAGHSLLVRRIGAAQLMLLMDPMRRGGFRKTQIGLKLFLPALLEALEAPEHEAPDLASDTTVTPLTKPSVLVVEDPIEEPIAEVGVPAAAPQPERRARPKTLRAPLGAVPEAKVPLRADREAEEAPRTLVPLRAPVDDAPAPSIPLRLDAGPKSGSDEKQRRRNWLGRGDVEG